MSTSLEFAMLGNATSLPWAEVPEWPVAEFVSATAAEILRGGRLCAWFGVPEDGATRLVAVLAFDADNTLAVGRSEPVRWSAGLRPGELVERPPQTGRAGDRRSDVDGRAGGRCSGSYPALTPLCAQAHLFEREVFEQHGLLPEGHPWLKPVRRASGAGPAVGNFFRVEGSELHEVAVGPVHAGIIEPGHFRFQCDGEEVLHLEIALGYQHRGVEEAIFGGPHRATLSQMETVAGDSTIAHATAHALVMEALAGTEAPLRAQWLRSIALELERLANHTGDLGALANDVAFLPTSAACGKIRGDFLNLTALICGNRFGRGLVRPGGSGHDLEPERAAKLLERLRVALAEVDQAATWLWDAASVRSRFESVGAVSDEQAQDIGLVGPAARACGLVRDVRYDHPAGWHRFAQVPVAVWPGGDVFARARVRWLEIQRSGQFLVEQIATPPEAEEGKSEVRSAKCEVGVGDGNAGQAQVNFGLRTSDFGLRTSDFGLSPAPDTLAVALVEGWRGETCHVGLTDGAGRLRRYKIVDPSFHNWTGLALALRGQAISDFPICNKSFNLSYCGFDL